MVNLPATAIPVLRARFIEAGGKPAAFDHAMGELWRMGAAEPENLDRIRRAGPRWQGALSAICHKLRREGEQP